MRVHQLRSALVTITLAALLVGCSDDAPVKPADDDAKAEVAEGAESAAEPVRAETPAPDTDMPSSDDLEDLIEALASSDLRVLEGARELTGEGSVARTYLEYLISGSNARLDSGTPQPDDLVEIESISGGYEACESGSAEAVCVSWTDIKGASGKVVDFSINEEPVADLLVAGNGQAVSVDAQGSVTLLYAYQSPVSGSLFVSMKATSGPDGMDTTGLYSANYRDPSGRQLGMLDAITPTEIGPDSTATLFVAFPAPATIGGTVTFDVYDSDYNAVTVTLPTS